MKKKTRKQRMTKTTGSSVMKKHRSSHNKVHRDGEKTYEAYADDYWDQAP